MEDEEGSIDKPILISGRDVTIDDTGKKSLTDFKVLERFKGYTFVQAEPQTGRRHQIRIHFWSLGHPLAIDAEYGVSDPLLLSSFKRKYKEKKDGQKEKPLIDRLTLHAAELTLTLPNTPVIARSDSGAAIHVKDKKMDSSKTKFSLNDGKITFSAPLPKDFEITLKQLRKYGK